MLLELLLHVKLLHIKIVPAANERVMAIKPYSCARQRSYRPMDQMLQRHHRPSQFPKHSGLDAGHHRIEACPGDTHRDARSPAAPADCAQCHVPA
jgi:hypothetical protein